MTARQQQHWLFVDGAGKPNDERYVAYCGYLIELTYLEDFFERWTGVIWPEQIPCLSMKEAQNWRGIWDLKRQQWGSEAEPKRAELLLRLADTVTDTRVYGIGHAVNTSSCREKQIEPTEYYLFVRLLETMFEAQGDGLQLIVVVDEEESAAERIYKFYRKLRLEKRHIAAQIKLIGIGDDRAIPALQAADLLAYTTIAELKRQVQTPGNPPSELWLRLTHGTNRTALTHVWFAPDSTEFLKLAGIV